MELLVGMVAELLLPLCGAAIALAVSVGSIVLEGVFWVVWLLTGRVVKSSAIPWRRIRIYGVLSLASVVLIGAVVVRLVYHDRVLVWLVDRAAEASGYAISYDGLGGNITAGVVELQGAELRREASPAAELTVDHVRIDVSLISLIWRPVEVESLEVSGVAGRVDVTERDDPADGTPPSAPVSFQVDHLLIEDADIRLQTPDRMHRIEIMRAESRPFRSRFAAFDLFFRSDVAARVDGATFEIVTETVSRGRATRWAFHDVPVDAVAALIDQPPLSWTEGGTVSGTLLDIWAIGDDAARVDSDVALVLNGVTITPPAGAGLVQATMATALAEVVNDSGEPVNLDFRLSLEEGDFDGTASLDARAFGDALMLGIGAVIAGDSDDVTAQEAADVLRERGLDLLQNLRDRDD